MIIDDRLGQTATIESRERGHATRRSIRRK